MGEYPRRSRSSVPLRLQRTRYRATPPATIRERLEVSSALSRITRSRYANVYTMAIRSPHLITLIPCLVSQKVSWEDAARDPVDEIGLGLDAAIEPVVGDQPP